MTWNRALWVIVLVIFFRASWDIGVLEKRMHALEDRVRGLEKVEPAQTEAHETAAPAQPATVKLPCKWVNRRSVRSKGR